MKTVYIPISPSSASALKGKTQKPGISIFSHKWCITVLTDFNQSLLNFFNHVDLRLILTVLLYAFLNLVVSEFQIWYVGGHSLEEIKLRAPDAPVQCVAERQNYFLQRFLIKIIILLSE